MDLSEGSVVTASASRASAPGPSTARKEGLTYFHAPHNPHERVVARIVIKHAPPSAPDLDS